MIKFSTRVVFILPKIIIKFPIDKRGYLQGKNELRLYKKYKHTNLLGQLLFEIGGIVVMKKYNVVNKVSQKDVIKIKTAIPELNIENCDLYNPNNWSKGILIDYGINEEVSQMY